MACTKIPMDLWEDVKRSLLPKMNLKIKLQLKL